MRARLPVAGFVVLATSLACPACAARLILPDDSPTFYSSYAAQPIREPWASRVPETQLVERPVADLIAARLGISEGSAQLFRFRIENGPSNATVLKGQIDGGGIRLKLTW